MKPRIITVLLPFLLIVSVYALTAPNPGHGSDNILIDIDGYTMTLQEAIDNDFLVECGSNPTQSLTTTVSPQTHDPSEVLVTIEGKTLTLQEAVSTSMCRQTSSMTSSILTGHNSDEISVDIDGVEMTLQEAIDSRMFCSTIDCSCAESICEIETCIDPVCGATCQGQIPSVDGQWSDWSAWAHTNGYDDGHGGTCSAACNGGTQSRTRTCDTPPPSCGGLYCIGSDTATQECNTQYCKWVLIEQRSIKIGVYHNDPECTNAMGEGPCSPYGDELGCVIGVQGADPTWKIIGLFRCGG